MAPSFDQVYPVLYKGWDEAGARADYNNGGWRNKAGAEQFTSGTTTDPGQRSEETIAQAQQRLQGEVNKRFTEYNQNNPFSADEYLKNQATAQANEQIGIESPQSTYYKENLNDYLLGVNRKIGRSTQDTNDLLSELTASTASYTGSLRNTLNESINNARQGMADTGMFDSGARYRQEGQLTAAAGEDLTNYQRIAAAKEKYYKTQNERTKEDYGIGQFSPSNPSAYIPGLISRGDIRGQYRTSATDVSTLAGQLTKEAGQNYVRGFNATLPPEMQANTNFDLLKQIGIYQ